MILVRLASILSVIEISLGKIFVTVCGTSNYFDCSDWTLTDLRNKKDLNEKSSSIDNSRINTSTTLDIIHISELFSFVRCSSHKLIIYLNYSEKDSHLLQSIIFSRCTLQTIPTISILLKVSCFNSSMQSTRHSTELI